ncbi:Aliphatic sulfonates import ATP-binding protein SsuB [Sporomusa ovata DSM 2662]|uniref:Alkanesulfonates ABC transporter ATP-binding protein / Sulfonate ABC transporter, ATP-binding subunit SsuB n=1 Tax=Sporomusa ovata TaxID=2378 RepID=A0A0U1KU02_9FIRM|nr:ABC transporter ATP-binding protein [Sporomusa ovata]EQB26818.1 ABC-type nitrate/sulfonate/bicarbonate transport system, ATPase component [Sporomusa ovata DSM 2662]CQR70918.1 Alkanesulfonates ABC transporter ATP-binding protein / Sulfonate ABC transporter, ATP-binding subunit SsuB [Sporomusa ovata]
MKDNNHVAITNLSKTYKKQNSDVLALNGITLNVSRNEFLCIVGASGCGKSTLLRILSGLDKEYNGSVSVGGTKISGPGLERGIVFQEHRLLPWLTVRDNIEFALQTGTQAEKANLIAGHLKLVGLAGFEKAYPNQLSGGMAQRVAIARALVNRPDILLLDEPFGALDALTRLKLQQQILAIWEKEKTTMIMVTHDIEEAVFLGDRVVVMSERPGTIKKEFEVDLLRPRNRSGVAFQQVRKEIYREFYADLM